MVAIIYETQGGSSERYAKWLAEKLGLACIPRKDLKDDIDECMIYVGWRSGPMVVGLKDLPDREKIIAVICVGLEQYDEKAMETIRKKNSVEKLFYVRGAMDRSKLKFGQKLLLAIVSVKMLLFDRSPEDREVRRVMDHGGDLSSPEQLDAFVEWYGSS